MGSLAAEVPEDRPAGATETEPVAVEATAIAPDCGAAIYDRPYATSVGIEFVGCARDVERAGHAMAAWTRAITAARFASPRQGIFQLGRASALFASAECSAGWSAPEPDFAPCLAAYCEGGGCAGSTAVAAMLSRAIERDHGVPATSAPNRLVAASLLPLALGVGPATGAVVVFELGPAAGDDVTAVLRVVGTVERVLPIPTEEERVEALGELPPPPISIAPRYFTLEHAAVLADLVARDVAFVFVREDT